MNRRQRREKAKQRKQGNKNNITYQWHLGPYSPKIEIEEEKDIPGVTSPPFDSVFAEIVKENLWHDRDDLDSFVETIKELSVEDNEDWTWSRNWDCKYLNLRFDMRGGGFILMDDEGKRINIEQLRWQFKSDVKE